MTHVVGLVDGLDTERRLLGELGRVLVAQRDGIATDDLASIDESVFAVQRILRTLQEARLRRRTLLRLLGATSDVELRELDDALGATMTDDVRVARDALLEEAEALQRELTVNRRVIDGALHVGDHLLRLFAGAQERPAVYSPGPAHEATGSGGLVDTRI